MSVANASRNAVMVHCSSTDDSGLVEEHQRVGGQTRHHDVPLTPIDVRQPRAPPSAGALDMSPVSAR